MKKKPKVGPPRPSENQLKMAHATRALKEAIAQLHIARDEVAGLFVGRPVFDKITAARTATEVALAVATIMLERTP